MSGNNLGIVNINVNTGKKLTFEDKANFGFTGNVGSGGSTNSTIQINGEIEMLSGSTFNPAINSTYTLNLNLTGSLKLNSGSTYIGVGGGIKNFNISNNATYLVATNILNTSGTLNLNLNSGNFNIGSALLDYSGGSVNITIHSGVITLGTEGTGLNRASKLYLVPEGWGVANGTWGSTASAAASKIDSYFAGTGMLTIVTSTLSIGKDDIAGFSLYPNPVKGGKVFINSANTYAERTIAVFDVLGKQVVAQKGTQNNVDVSHLNKGIYIMKVEEVGKVATRKLVIE